MKLYQFPFAPNATRLLYYLHEKGLEDAVEQVTVDFFAGAQRSAEFLVINPRGTVPVLELDDGTRLTESVAIIEYLEELYPHPPMIGTTPVTRAQARALERYIELNIHLRVVRLVHASRSPLGLPPNEALASNERQRLPAALAVIDTQLAEQAYCGGASPAIADCTLLSALNFARIGDLQPESGYRHIEAWFERYSERHAGPQAR